MVRFKQMRWPLLACGAALLATCAANQAALREAQAGISLDYLTNDIATLGSDEFMGRKPGRRLSGETGQGNWSAAGLW